MLNCVLPSYKIVFASKMSGIDIDSFDCLGFNHDVVHTNMLVMADWGDHIGRRIAKMIGARIPHISIRHRRRNIFIHLLHFITIVEIG